MDGTCGTCVLLSGLPFVDRFRFDLECLLNPGSEHLGQLSDLVKAVLAFFERVHPEVERSFLEAIGDAVESDRAAAAMEFHSKTAFRECPRQPQ